MAEEQVQKQKKQYTLKPLVTEKTSVLADMYNGYTFEVDSTLNKIEIKNAVEAEHKVTVEKVNTINTRIERKKKYTKKGIQIATKKAIKKAVVYLKEGQTLDFYTEEQQ